MAELGLKKIETGVDRLISFIKGKGLIELAETSKQLNMPQEIVQSWVDFLVEENLIGIEYKFTKPYIYFIEKTGDNSLPHKTNKELDNYKKKFKDEAKEKDIPENKTEFLWKTHLLKEVEHKKTFFFQQATLRNMDNPELLWEEYKKRIGA